jgi:uncharacterized YigZ family protein
MTDHFQVPASEHAAEIRVQRSLFRALVVPTESEESFATRLGQAEREHHDATHHCWAFRLFDPPLIRSSDAGEPSGSAGRPIAQAIESAGLSDVGVIVIRWYGGVKLGTGGLARAYRDAAAEALAGAPRLDRWLYESVDVRTHHRNANLIFRLVSPPDVVLDRSEFGEEARFSLRVRRSMIGRLTAELESHRIAFTRR